MKRDLDLIRLILLDLEKEEEVSLAAYSDAQITYHKALAYEAGLAEGRVHEKDGLPDLAILLRLTWAGHEFLDEARSETTWNKAKSIVKEKGMSISVEAMKIALSEAIKILMG